jgi:phage terminase large subunit GpA-like protein
MLRDRRNEALDQEVYALAALHILGTGFIRGLPQRAARFAQPVLMLDGIAGERAPAPPIAWCLSNATAGHVTVGAPSA